MLNNQEFDLWADGYDKSVALAEENDEYPFAGYKKILNKNIIQHREKIRFLYFFLSKYQEEIINSKFLNLYFLD